jgi:hypothetical protein
LVVLFAIQYPDSYNFAHQNLDVLRTTPSTEFSGIQFNSTNRAELIDAQQYIKNNHINTLFAFPLIPEFYSFVRSHPTRVVYFEPEIQRQELTETAAELQKNPPQLIVQELGQTLGLSPVLYPLDDYISSHYDTTQYIHSGRVIELRTMKPTPQVTRRLMDRAYVSNPGRDSELSVDLQSVGTPVAPALIAVGGCRICNYRECNHNSAGAGANGASPCERWHREHTAPKQR